MRKSIFAIVVLLFPLSASAATVNGGFYLFPSASVNKTADTITFLPDGAGALAPTFLGDFAPLFSGGTTFLTMSNFNVPTPYAQIGVNSDLFWCGGCTFSITHWNNAMQFDARTSVTFLDRIINPPQSSINEAYITGSALVTTTGFDPTLAHYILSIDAGHFWNPQGEYYNNWTMIALNTTGPLHTPIPAALPLFLTGLGMLGWLGWRRC
jgi:hypothetical protein